MFRKLFVVIMKLCVKQIGFKTDKTLRNPALKWNFSFQNDWVGVCRFNTMLKLYSKLPKHHLTFLNLKFDPSKYWRFCNGFWRKWITWTSNCDIQNLKLFSKVFLCWAGYFIKCCPEGANWWNAVMEKLWAFCAAIWRQHFLHIQTQCTNPLRCGA